MFSLDGGQKWDAVSAPLQVRCRMTPKYTRKVLCTWCTVETPLLGAKHCTQCNNKPFEKDQGLLFVVRITCHHHGHILVMLTQVCLNSGRPWIKSVKRSTSIRVNAYKLYSMLLCSYIVLSLSVRQGSTP